MVQYGIRLMESDGSGEGFSKHLPKEDVTTFGRRWAAGSKNHWFHLVYPVAICRKAVENDRFK